MPKGHVMSKPFLVKPMKDTMLDYTWRTNGKEVLICPECKKNLGEEGSDPADLVIKEHKMFGNCHPVSTEQSQEKK